MSRLQTLGVSLASATIAAGMMWVISAKVSEPSPADRTDFQVARMDGSWAFDRSDVRQLAGASDALLIVKISEQVQTEMLDTGPQTYFDAEVVYSFKGSAPRSSRIRLAQEAGYVEESNTLYLFEGDPLLEADRVYLVATRVDESNQTYTVVPGAGTQDVTDLSPAEINAYKTKYAKAVSNQIALPADSGRR